jgi:hypothetical protein
MQVTVRRTWKKTRGNDSVWESSSSSGNSARNCNKLMRNKTQNNGVSGSPGATKMPWIKSESMSMEMGLLMWYHLEQTELQEEK